jgi:hypothetical protein
MERTWRDMAEPVRDPVEFTLNHQPVRQREQATDSGGWHRWWSGGEQLIDFFDVGVTYENSMFHRLGDAHRRAGAR